MSSDHRILLQTNPPWLKTGLAENARTLLSYLYQRGYTIAHYCTQGTPTNHPQLGFTPWPSFGCIPPDPQLVAQINSDPTLARDASYGCINIDAVIKEWKPTIWIGSDDIWSHPLSHYSDKPWYAKINSIHHTTIDSMPVLGQAFEQAKRSKHYLTWSKFGARAMRREGPARGYGDMSHVSSIYGAMDITAFSPISEAEKADLRKRFNIPDDTLIFLFVSRNQLRKSFNRVLEAYSRFKKDHPNVRSALHFHTSFSEKQMGWDLPVMATYYGIPSNEILCTYICRNCGSWFVSPFGGEELKCPVCNGEKSVITATITNGVPGNQMKFIYGLSDACLSIFTSGGQEYHSVQSLLCGKTLACTNYSCGEDFCVDDTEGFVTPIGWTSYDEPGTNFIKAANKVSDITSFMRSFVRQPKRAIEVAGERARDWAIKNFGIESVGDQWVKLFETLPYNLDWSSVDIMRPARKNDTVPMPIISDNGLWVKTLYQEILLMTMPDGDEGVRHWLAKLEAGMPREHIYQYFLQVARQENQKNGWTESAATDFSSLIDRQRTETKRLAFVIKESVGDCLICTQLFESLVKEYPQHDIYLITDPKNFPIFDGNPFIYKLLPYTPQCENELIMTSAGQDGEPLFHVFMHPGILTQRQLGYLSLKE